MGTAAIELKNITKCIGSVVANNNVCLTVNRGEILSILGENGSGKTTLMNMISGIYFPDDGHIYIKGRSKNMLLGASGQNIYPEEIEDKLNSLPYVSECIVIQRDEKLYGLVHPDYDEAEKAGLDENGLRQAMEQNRNDLNMMVAGYEKLAGIKIFAEEFEKTPKRSIKRFLYENVEI